MWEMGIRYTGSKFAGGKFVREMFVKDDVHSITATAWRG